jgi:hypothetical protein
MQVSPAIDYLAATQRVYLFVPENVVFTFYDNVEKVFELPKNQFKGESKSKRVFLKASTLSNIM